MRGSDGVTVAGCGAIAVDEILLLDRGWTHGKGKVVRREVAHGGNVATALAAVSVLGGSARWLGYLPDGAAATDLASYGVDVYRAAPTPTPPIRSTILVDPTGERFIAFDDDTPLGMPAGTTTEEASSALDGVGALLVDTYAARDGMPLVRAAAESGIPVVADIERLDFPRAVELLEAASHPVIPLEIGREITGRTPPEDVLRGLWTADRTAVVVTDGARGAWYVTAEGVRHAPAFVMDVVDTNGCGDVFHGAFALRIAQGLGVGEAVEHASAAGAVCATAAGGRGHLPTDDDLTALLSTGRRSVTSGHGA